MPPECDRRASPSVPSPPSQTHETQAPLTSLPQALLPRIAAAAAQTHRRATLPQAPPASPHPSVPVAYGQQGAGASIPPDATLEIEIELLAVRPPSLRVGAPDVFRTIDADDSGVLDEQEVEAHFASLGKPVPPTLWSTEDKDKDHRISWDEFSGPKQRRLAWFSRW